jgi:hypothetical protein
MADILASLSPNSPAELLRSLRVILPNQDNNIIKNSWPGIGCWFWTEEEFRPEGYKRFLDLYAKHTNLSLITTSLRYPVEITDNEVHSRVKEAVRYGQSLGLEIVMDLDARLARESFHHHYPDELQEFVRMRDVQLINEGETYLRVESINLSDHYTMATRGYDSIAARVLRVFIFNMGPGGIEKETITDITDRVKTTAAGREGLEVMIPVSASEVGKTVCVMAAFTLFTPDLFSPNLMQFERNILQQYADIPLAGACKDEWGFPGRFDIRYDDLFYSDRMALAYEKLRPGCDLTKDMLIMARGLSEGNSEQVAAINYYMELVWRRSTEVENAFYNAIKSVFGMEAMSGTHPTWYPYPNQLEIFKNGLSWWACRRDLAQTDEGTPYGVRTALAKKWHSPVWYNMYYEGTITHYEENLWRHVLGGGRINYHPVWPHPIDKLTTSLLTGNLFAAEARIGLLNFISTAPVDCPVAVIFGHPAALNWSGPGFADTGMAVVDRLWEQGYYTDLIPSSEIWEGNLIVSSDGYITYGPQKYKAVILHQPQYDRPIVADFFRKAATMAKTALFRIGEWTLDFDGNSFDGETALPEAMRQADPHTVPDTIVALLRSEGTEAQTKCTMPSAAGFPASMMPRRSGVCRLLDGTIIHASGEHDVMGDPIRKTFEVGGQQVSFDAVGIAAVRLDQQGRFEAMAAGGLKSFSGGGISIEMDEPMDLSLWRDANGVLRGVTSGCDLPLPAELKEITPNWVMLAVPQPYTGKP